MTVKEITRNTTHVVKQYKDVLYLKLNHSNKVPYYILQKANYTIEEIETGYEYNHYITEQGELYTGFYSNVYKSFAQDNEQLSLFNAQDYF